MLQLAKYLWQKNSKKFQKSSVILKDNRTMKRSAGIDLLTKKMAAPFGTTTFEPMKT